jgi:2-keto-4-pentenoate hydratase/2-oxohepta-3-ene-1,7-dioic acid hydratase in catechol pathway
MSGSELQRPYRRDQPRVATDAHTVFKTDNCYIRAVSETITVPKLAQDGTSHDEAELCVMIRITGTNIPESGALGYVLGYTAFNGVSVRILQLLHRSGAFRRGSIRVVPSVSDNLDGSSHSDTNLGGRDCLSCYYSRPTGLAHQGET